MSSVQSIELSQQKRWLLALLLASPLMLMAIHRLFLLPYTILAITGIVLLIQQWRTDKSLLLQDKAVQCFYGVFLLLWLPMLIANIDTETPKQSWKVTNLFFLYSFMGIAVFFLLRKYALYRQVYVILSVMLVFWAVDALFQTIFKFDVFGVPLIREKATVGKANIFFTRPNTFGFYMGLMACLPLYFMVLQKTQRIWQMLIAAVLSIGVLLGSIRAGWVMFFWAMLPFAYWFYWRKSQRPWLLLVGTVSVTALLLALMIKLSPGIQERLQTTKGFQTWDYHAVNVASSLRLDIWWAATKIGYEHPINGLGTDSFEEKFRPYLPPQAIWPADIDAAHPHQVVLEIWAATGSIGILGFFLAWWVVWRLWQQANKQQRLLALPMLMPFFVLWWPINTHIGFYMSEVATLTLFMLGFVVAALTHQEQVK